MLDKLSYYLQKSKRIGLQKLIKVCCIRARSVCVNRYWRYQVACGNQSNRARDIAFRHRTSRNLSYIKQLYGADIRKQQLIEEANAYVNNEFSFLGSPLQKYAQIPWHCDFRLQQHNAHSDIQFDSVSFYKDLRIEQGSEGALVKDIKVPWELSRFAYLYVLGKTYEYTNDQRYVDVFQRYVSDWLDNNNYLCGINWLCPMEVGIRAINWIVAWESFKNEPSVSSDFSARFIASLYDHMIYLENNWEYYDSRTNNHYLSNLVAYLYLCWFFSDIPGIEKKRAWVAQEILRECEKQVFTEGTNYEGSTHYHCLVTELFYHAHLLFQEMNIHVPEHFHTTLSRMFDFIDWCTVDGSALVSVGDNDSGKVLYYGLTRTMVAHMKMISVNSKPVAYFPRFGLSVVKTDAWHITLRHHAYNALQPSGHFHNDVGSITLAVNGIPIIIDPGSFVYTPSVAWRNYFRSAITHNTSFILGAEPVSLMDELFVLNVPERLIDEVPIADDNFVLLHAKHNLYERLGVKFARQIQVDDNCIQINDVWTGFSEKQDLTCGWNFTLAPDIVAYKQDNSWLLMHQGTSLVMLRSYDVVFVLHEAWVSPAYGQKVVTQSLRASRLLDNTPVVIEFIKV